MAIDVPSVDGAQNKDLPVYRRPPRLGLVGLTHPHSHARHASAYPHTTTVSTIYSRSTLDSTMAPLKSGIHCSKLWVFGVHSHIMDIKDHTLIPTFMITVKLFVGSTTQQLSGLEYHTPTVYTGI